MRKTLIALMLAAALPAVAMAGGPGDGPGDGPGMGKGPGFGPGHHRAPYAELNLSPEQRQQIDKLVGGEMHGDREITERYLEKLPAADQLAMKNEIKAKQDKTQADIRALLKPDQQKQFDEIKQKEDKRRADWKEFQAWKAAKGQTTDKTQ